MQVQSSRSWGWLQNSAISSLCRWSGSGFGPSRCRVRHPHSDALPLHPPTPPCAHGATPPASDLTALVAQAQQGDLDAQSALVRRYTNRVAGFVRTIVRDSSAVEDVVQTVFIKMVRRLPWLRDSGSFESWLFATARSTSLDFLRRARRRPATTTLETVSLDVPDTSNAGMVNEILDALQLALAALSAKDQRLVTMVLQGHSYSFIAKQEALTVGAVKARLCRVRPFLRATVGGATGTRPPGELPPQAAVRCPTTRRPAVDNELSPRLRCRMAA
jgi:RNA polymerase sigma factor (sigma-70 family)